MGVLAVGNIFVDKSVSRGMIRCLYCISCQCLSIHQMLMFAYLDIWYAIVVFAQLYVIHPDMDNQDQDESFHVEDVECMLGASSNLRFGKSYRNAQFQDIKHVPFHE